MNSRSTQPRNSEESQVQPTSSEGEEVSRRPLVVTIVGLFAWVLSAIAAADDDWVIISTLSPGRASTGAICFTVHEEDGHWCALYRTFIATQCIATVLCTFATLVLAVPAGSRKCARRMGNAMRVLLACSVFFQLVAACLAASVYLHLRIHHPYHDGSGFPAMLLGPTFVLAWGAILVALVEISLLRISHPESRGTGPHQEPPFRLGHIYTRNHPKSRFWVLLGIGSLIVVFDVTTLVNYVDASGLSSPGLQSIPLVLCVSSVIFLVWSASHKQATKVKCFVFGLGVLASLFYPQTRFAMGMLGWANADEEVRDSLRDGMRDLWLWPLVLSLFYLGGLVWTLVIDVVAFCKYRRGEQGLPQHHERSLQQRDNRFRHWRSTVTPAEATTRPPTGVHAAAAAAAAPGTSGERTTSRLSVGGDLAFLTAVSGSEQLGSSIIWSAAPVGQHVEAAPGSASVSVTRPVVSPRLPAQ
ncbi:unnamed protein product [Ectocarpus sp. 6 AP-2014]